MIDDAIGKELNLIRENSRNVWAHQPLFLIGGLEHGYSTKLPEALLEDPSVLQLQYVKLSIQKYVDDYRYSGVAWRSIPDLALLCIIYIYVELVSNSLRVTNIV